MLVTRLSKRGPPYLHPISFEGNSYLSQGVGVGVASESEGSETWAHGDNGVNNNGGVDNGIVGVTGCGNGGCESENGGE